MDDLLYKSYTEKVTSAVSERYMVSAALSIVSPTEARSELYLSARQSIVAPLLTTSCYRDRI